MHLHCADITKLKGPKKWTYFYLYAILDIFSRRVVGWQVAGTDSAALFKPLLDQAVQQNGVPPGQPTPAQSKCFVAGMPIAAVQ